MKTGNPYVDLFLDGIQAADQEAAASRKAFLLGPDAFQKHFDKKYSHQVAEWEKENVPADPAPTDADSNPAKPTENSGSSESNSHTDPTV
jgi:hypothetical protein